MTFTHFFFVSNGSRQLMRFFIMDYHAPLPAICLMHCARPAAGLQPIYTAVFVRFPLSVCQFRFIADSAHDSLFSCVKRRVTRNLWRSSGLNRELGMGTNAEAEASPSWLQIIVIGRNPRFTLARVVVLVVLCFAISKY